MSPVVSIIGTVVLLAILVIGIVKKLSAPTTMMMMGFIGLFVIALITGTSPLGASGSGSMFIDALESVVNTLKSTIQGNGLIIMSAVAYVSFMSTLKASTMFGLLVAKPFQKIKKPYILLAATVVLVSFLKGFISSGIAVAALAYGTIYPILRQCKIPKISAGSAILVGISGGWTVANQYWIMINEAGGYNYSPVFLGLRWDLPINLITMTIIGIILSIISSKLDSKAGVVESEDENLEIITPESLGIPKAFAILPTLPLVFLIVFSNLFFEKIALSIVAANLLSFMVCFVVLVIKNRDRESYAIFNTMFVEMGNSLGRNVGIILAAMVFSAALKGFGGLSLAFSALSSSSGGTVVMSIIGGLLAFAMDIATGSITSITPLFASMYAELAGNGILTLTEAVYMYMNMSKTAVLGHIICPIAAPTLYTISSCDSEFGQMFKRLFGLTLGSVVIVNVVILVFYMFVPLA